MLLALCRTLSITLALSSIAATAQADGPHEPNETAAQVAGSLTGAPIAAALETPQDIDWYRFYAKPQRQVGLLATLGGTCSSSSGSITVRVYDADGGYGLPVVSLILGYAFGAANLPQTAAEGTFTSELGHRYFIQARQSLCQNVGYTLQLAPGDDLTDRLQDTLPCVKARGAASAAHHRLSGLRAAAKKARGSRRQSLRSRVALQRQQVVVADANAKSACARRPLEGYPFT